MFLLLYSLILIFHGVYNLRYRAARKLYAPAGAAFRGLARYRSAHHGDVWILIDSLGCLLNKSAPKLFRKNVFQNASSLRTGSRRSSAAMKKTCFRTGNLRAFPM